MPDDCILAYRESDGLPICRTHNCLLLELEKEVQKDVGRKLSLSTGVQVSATRVTVRICSITRRPVRDPNPDGS